MVASLTLSPNNCSTSCSTPVGSAGGRYLNDVWALHVEGLVWELVSAGGRAAAHTASQEASGPDASEQEALLAGNVLPPCAGHALVPWGSHLLCIGGHVKVRAGFLVAAAREQRWYVYKRSEFVLITGSLCWACFDAWGLSPSQHGHVHALFPPQLQEDDVSQWQWRHEEVGTRLYRGSLGLSRPCAQAQTAPPAFGQPSRS